MRRPGWTANAMARRVMMSSDGLWVFTEGRVTDAAFYDRLLTANAKAAAAGHRVRLIETMKLDARYGGGKHAVIKLFEHYKRSGRLTQTNSAGTCRMLFLLDADLDRLLGRTKRSAHVIYTTSRDAEAEIHLHGNLARALSTSMSLTLREADSLAARVGDHTGALADLWREWIELGAQASASKSHGPLRYGKPSVIHTSNYGPVDPLAQSAQLAQVVNTGAVADPAAKARYASRRVAGLYGRGEGSLLVKGKWLPDYLKYRIKFEIPPGAPVDLKGLNTITKCLLDTLDFQQPWAQPYHVAIDLIT